MPHGAALSQRGKLIADRSVQDAKVEQGTDGLVRTAAALVRDLAGGEQGSSQTVRTSSAGGGSPAWIWIVVGVAVAAALGAIGYVLARARRRKPA
jgi:hypothetical protein